jgi:hypothetical protein
LVRGAISAAPVELMREKVKTSVLSASASSRIVIGTKTLAAPSAMTMLPPVVAA